MQKGWKSRGPGAQAGSESSRQSQQQYLQLPPPPTRHLAKYSNSLRQQGLHPLQWRQPPRLLQQRQPLCHCRRDTRSPSKKRKVEMPSDSDPATPEGGSFTLLSQLDGADLDFQLPTPPTPEPDLPDSNNLQERDMWTTVRPSR